MQVTTCLRYSLYPEIKIALWLAASPVARKLPQIPRNAALHLAVGIPSVRDGCPDMGLTWVIAKRCISNLHAMYSIGCPDVEESGLVHAFINLDQSDLFLPMNRL